MFHNIESRSGMSTWVDPYTSVQFLESLSVRQELAFHDRINLFEAEKNTRKPMKIRQMQSWFKKQFKPFHKFCFKKF